jgi:hypothetical protein
MIRDAIDLGLLAAFLYGVNLLATLFGGGA